MTLGLLVIEKKSFKDFNTFDLCDLDKKLKLIHLNKLGSPSSQHATGPIP